MRGSLAANSRDRSARIPAVEPRTTRPADMGTHQSTEEIILAGQRDVFWCSIVPCQAGFGNLPAIRPVSWHRPIVSHPACRCIRMWFHTLVFLLIFPVDRSHQKNRAVLRISSMHDDAGGVPDGDQVRCDGDIADQRVADDAAAVVQ